MDNWKETLTFAQPITLVGGKLLKNELIVEYPVRLRITQLHRNPMYRKSYKVFYNFDSNILNHGLNSTNIGMFHLVE